MKRKYTVQHPPDEQYIAKWKRHVVISETGCWLWQKFIQPVTGYADIGFRGKRTKAHRAMYTATNGPIPEGLAVLHSCDVRHCINPDHLRVGTISENKQDELQRGRNWEASKEFCNRGHSYAEHGVRHGTNQWRKCKICARGKHRVRAGWPEDLAYSIGPIPKGQATNLAIHWERRGRERKRQE